MRRILCFTSLILILCLTNCQLYSGKSLSLYQDAEDHFKTYMTYETINPELALEHYKLANEKITTLFQMYPASKISQELRNNQRKINGVSLKDFLEIDS